MIYFAVDDLRVHLLEHYLARESGRPLRGRIRQVSYTELFRAQSLPRGAWIFTALDALTGAELQMVHCMQCAARSRGLTVLNSALEALDRYRLLTLLAETGRNDFRAHRADGPLDSVRFPVFVRVAAEHDGSLTPLIHNQAELRRAMAYLWMRGLVRSQLLVVEFCETAGADGLYRKYSIFRVGNSYVPRYLHIGPHWMTKSHTTATDERLALEEMDWLRGNPHGGWARGVFEAARVEYGRLDYGVRNGRPQAWEINLTPVLAGNPERRRGTPEEERFRELARPAKEFAHVALRDAFERLDPGTLSGGDVPFELPADLLAQARLERRRVCALDRRRQRISRIAGFSAFRAVGPALRRTLRIDR